MTNAITNVIFFYQRLPCPCGCGLAPPPWGLPVETQPLLSTHQTFPALEILQLSGKAPHVLHLCLLLILPHCGLIRLSVFTTVEKLKWGQGTHLLTGWPWILWMCDSHWADVTGQLIVFEVLVNFWRAKTLIFQHFLISVLPYYCADISIKDRAHMYTKEINGCWQRWGPGHWRVPVKTLLTDVWNISHRQEGKWKMTPLASHRICSVHCRAPWPQMKNKTFRSHCANLLKMENAVWLFRHDHPNGAWVWEEKRR